MHLSINDIANTILIAALVLFVLYRRFRRNFGRQRLRQNRMIFRMVVFGAFCLFLLFSPYGTTKSFAAALLGAATGLVLALYATAHTQFELTPEGKFFTPNVYIGMTVTALFIGRLIYRFVVLYPVIHDAAHQARENSSSPMGALNSYQHSPLTLGLYFLLAGYYICYYAGILIKCHELGAGGGDQGRSKFIT
jgi:hypothetical protein